MKRNTLLVALSLAFLFVIAAHETASGQSACPSGEQCRWIDVRNVVSYGVPWSASSQQFENVPATKDHLCQMQGYSYGRGEAWATRLAQWADCNGEYHVNWTGSDWSSKLCNNSRTYVTDIYCAKTVPPNNSPTIAWSVAPGSAACNASYDIEAIGRDADGNLSAVSVDKDGSPFAYNGGGDGYEEMSGNPTSDAGPRTATFTAWATDSAGARSATIRHTVDIAACPVANRDPGGAFSANCDNLFGTAIDADAVGSPVDVHFYIDGPAGSGSFLGVASSNSTGQYVTPTPASVKTGSQRTLYAYAINIPAGNNPQIGQATINCPAPVTPLPGGPGGGPSTLPPAPTITIGASPTSLPAGGGSVDISWAVTSAANCTASGAWSGAKDRTSGRETVSVSSTSNFTLSCTGLGGQSSQSVTVSVASAPIIIPGGGNSASLSLSRMCVGPGESVTFSSTAGGSGISSHIIEKDSNQDGIYGTLRSFGALGGTQNHAESFGAGTYDFRTVVNGSVYSAVSRLTVSPSCALPPVNPGNPGNPSNPPVNPGNPAPGGGGGAGGGGSCRITSAPTSGPLSISLSGNTARLSWNYPAGECAHNWAGAMSGKSSSGTYTATIPAGGQSGWLLFCGTSGWTIPTAQYGVTASCAPAVPVCNDPSAVNNGQPGACVYPAFTITATPSTVKAKSLAGYSGITEREVRLTVNPAYGFDAPVRIEVDASSLPSSVKPEYSFGGGAFTSNPSATMTWDGSYYRNAGLIDLPVVVRFGGVLEKDKTYSLVIRGTGLPGGRGSGKTASTVITIDSKPLYPKVEEI